MSTVSECKKSLHVPFYVSNPGPPVCCMGSDALQYADFAYSQVIALLKQTLQTQGCFEIGSFHCTAALQLLH